MCRRSSSIRRIRVGFTLIEMLMVMAIIAILIGVLVPVIIRARNKGEEGGEIAEINNLAAGLEKFKDRYGCYPPSQIILREDGDYSTQTLYTSGANNYLDGHVDAPTYGASGVFFRDISIEYLQKIWPQISLNTGSGAGNAPGIVTTGPVANQYFYDWNGNGTFDNVTVHLTGDECLVFFLGGIPGGTPTDNSSVRPNQGPPGVAGFSKDPKNPTVAPVAGQASASRDGPFFEFAGSRLVDWRQNGFYEYLPWRRFHKSESRKGGYAYFSSYDGQGYRPDDMNLDTKNVTTESEPTGLSSIPAGGFLEFRVNYVLSGTYPYVGTVVAGQPITSVRSPGPNPYTDGAPYLTGVSISRFLKPKTFQIISPGLDNSYGQGGAWPRLGQTGFTASPFYTEVREDDDNLTNFSKTVVKDGNK